ncbi:MAG TPA: Xaa-Pro dipeptidase [Candidatus Krumholzibacteria bacterium]|jgi:Xaa-Pro dipeptidase
MLELYAAHLDTLSQRLTKILQAAAAEGEKFDGIVFHAGSQDHYYADDREIPFVRTPHFSRLCPTAGKDHLLVYEPGKKFRLLRVLPPDFWYEPAQELDHPYAAEMDVQRFDSADAALLALGSLPHHAFLGRAGEASKKLGATVEPKGLMALLDWDRAYKSAYEVECVREAGRIASLGHRAVREAVDRGLSERQLHAVYLEATQMLDHQTPYNNIIGWDDHGSILHYQSKDTQPPRLGKTLLIDAGANCFGYASDVTRTYARAGTDALFVDLLDRMDDLQRELVESVGPGVDYVSLHEQAMRGIVGIVCETGLVRCGEDAAFERGHGSAFFPHGLGHHLGIQVHDIGGRQAKPKGGENAPPANYPFLRTTRALEPGNVVTIEPGLYFIPLLLDPLRPGKHAADFDWDRIDAMIPLGGIRIEDNVCVTEEGRQDLTRPYIPGHR